MDACSTDLEKTLHDLINSNKNAIQLLMLYNVESLSLNNKYDRFAYEVRYKEGSIDPKLENIKADLKEWTKVVITRR